MCTPNSTTEVCTVIDVDLLLDIRIQRDQVHTPSDAGTEWQSNFKSYQSHQIVYEISQIPQKCNVFDSYFSLGTVMKQIMEITKQTLRIEYHKTQITN